MPGIDKRRIVDKKQSDLDELTCGICHDILDEPVVTQCCRQTYCKSCINQWLTENNTCPNDRQELDVNRLIKPPRLVLNLLNKLQAKCENYLNGCQKILALDQLQEHLKMCSPCTKCRELKIVAKVNQEEIELLKTKLSTSENFIETLLANQVASKSSTTFSSKQPSSFHNDFGQEYGDLPCENLVKFIGHWKHVSTNNLKRNGLKYLPTSSNFVNPLSRLKIIKDGEYYLLIESNLVRKNVTKFKLDEQFEQDNIGYNETSLFTFDGNKLIQVKKEPGMLVICLREIIEGLLTVTSIGNGIKGVVVYKRQN